VNGYEMIIAGPGAEARLLCEARFWTITPPTMAQSTVWVQNAIHDSADRGVVRGNARRLQSPRYPLVYWYSRWVLLKIMFSGSLKALVAVHGGLSQFSWRRRYWLWGTVFRRENGTVPFGR